MFRGCGYWLRRLSRTHRFYQEEPNSLQAEIYRTWDLDDVAGILRTLGRELDLDYVDREAARMEVFGTWRGLLVRGGQGRV